MTLYLENNDHLGWKVFHPTEFILEQRALPQCDYLIPLCVSKCINQDIMGS